MTGRAILLLAALTLAGIAILASCDDENPSGPGTPPTPSTLSATAGATNSVAAAWTLCVDTDFSEYRLYRSTEPGISQDPPASPLFVTANPMDTTFTDTGLEWGETYYYAVRTFDSENLSSWSNEVAAVVPDSGSGGGDALTCYEVQGQQAQSPYLDQVVTVTGIVTVGGDEYYNSSGPVAVLGDPEGGPWTGLVLFGDEVGALARGDSVLITGTVDEYYDLTEMTLITDVEIVSSGHALPPATDVGTGDIAGSKASAEEYEGVLCTVSDAVVTEVQGYGQFLADDGSGDCMIDDMGDYSYSPAEGDTLFSATGVLWYSYSEFKLEPRDDGDLDVSGGGGGDAYTCYEIQGQQAASPFDGQSVSVTGIVVVAGGEWYSSSSAYAVIMDADGGPWSGLTLYGSEVADLARGDSVTVTGTIDEYYELTEMTYPYTGVVVHGTGHALPDPEPLDTGDVGDEQWESVLVSVSDATVTDEPDSYGQWMVDDGSGDLMVDDLGDYTYEPTLGDTLGEIVGICWYSFDDFKLEPRDDDDLTE